MKVVVDQAKCSGHARCHAVNPDLFELDDVGYANRALFEVPEGLEAQAHEGAASCPERAISVED